MIATAYGSFTGKTWESLCQLVFKRKYAQDGYQAMPANPGDYGIEGYTIKTGVAFQCYCPEKHYDTSNLYKAQRDKITKDVAKLKKNEKEIAARLGVTKIRDWVFVTPTFEANQLLKHAKDKELEVKSWGLSYIDPAFSIHIRDAEFYVQDINEIRSFEGKPLVLDPTPSGLPALTQPPEVYEANIERKSRLRLAPKLTATNSDRLVPALKSQVLESFLNSDAYLREIERQAPPVYASVLRVISEYEYTVTLRTTTWTGSAEELTDLLTQGLTERIRDDIGSHLDNSSASKISRLVIARWIAICQLDFI